MDTKLKADNLASRMNKITDEFTKNLDLSDDLELTGDDIIDHVEEKTHNIELKRSESLPEEGMSEAIASQIVNLNTMVKDFKYVRDTLKGNTDNGRRVLNKVTLDLLDVDEETRASLISSFAELNQSVALNMKLYISSYKEISGVLLNLDKIKKEEAKNSTTVNNTLNVTTEAISTYDLINKLGKVIENGEEVDTQE